MVKIPLSDTMLAEQIERLIDDYGIDNFLSVLGYVCGEKAEIIATANARLAKHWMSLSADLDKLTAKAEEWKL